MITIERDESKRVDLLQGLSNGRIDQIANALEGMLNWRLELSCPAQESLGLGGLFFDVFARRSAVVDAQMSQFQWPSVFQQEAFRDITALRRRNPCDRPVDSVEKQAAVASVHPLWNLNIGVSL
eukprot:Protomagalhaensia_sp_Gyna_25__5861@NODE_879_length_2469_cov_110_234979_g693_i0_p2_GENE_NODE_879_length_2469_cov_110_234979_g693_i0NODE_879_length_2469_cov_110_234979_g693_i0_p2_ORF_typecomplete_len124_score25_15_NODE_879_length_2469_cov_110_234979_g693_i0260631